jgi:hypothetical protein
MKKLLIVIGTVLLVLGFNFAASAWVYVPNQGDTGWHNYAYTVGSGGFSGSAGFAVSNVIDNYSYPELLLDNLSLGGEGTNQGFELGNFTGFNSLSDTMGTSFGNVSTSATSYSYTTYAPTEGYYFASLLGLYNGVTTSQFSNATGQAGTVGSILETALILTPGTTFSFDWAFLGSDYSPWDDFAMFYLKDQSGNIVFSEGLAQIGSAPAVPLPSTLLLLGSGLCGLLGLGRRAKRRVG